MNDYGPDPQLGYVDILTIIIIILLILTILTMTTILMAAQTGYNSIWIYRAESS